MPKDDGLYLGHMLDVARKVRTKVEGKSRGDFDGDEDLRYTLTHLLQIIGEAARRVSPSTREQNATIPWKAIVGMRHRIVHDYLGVDEGIVWATVTEEIPTLIAQLESSLPESETT